LASELDKQLCEHKEHDGGKAWENSGF